MSYLNFLIIITTFIILIISSKSQEEFSFFTKQQKDLLSNSCQKNSVFCPMTTAIENIFNQIKEEEIQTQLECFNLCLRYNNILVRDMLCKELDITDSSSYTITLRNCSVLISGEIEFENKGYKVVKFGNFLSEFLIDSLSFTKDENLKNFIFSYQNSTKKFNYDTTRAVFKSSDEDLISQMNDILDEVYDKFLKQMIKNSDQRFNIANYFDKAKNQIIEDFSLFKEKGITINSKKKNVTYLLFTNLNPLEEIQIRNKYIFYNMNVTFEYALNYNVTYNEGYFIVKYICFENDESKNNNYFEQKVSDMVKRADFDILDNSNDIWEIIFDEFKKKFNEAKKDKEHINERKNSRYFNIK